MLAQPLHIERQIGLLRSGEWVYERKLDGLRCLAVRNGAEVELWSRNHLSFGRRFPTLVSAVAAIPVDNFAFDGEIVAFDGDRTDFALLHNPPPKVRVMFCAFDVVHLLGLDTTTLPLVDRISLLERAITGEAATLGTGETAIIGTAERVWGDPDDLLRSACERGWEGLVAKRAQSVYRSGRSPDWRKLKCSGRQELVVGGWTEPSGSRFGLGALLVGFYESEGRLRYAGRVGSGFDTRSLSSLRTSLDAIRAEQSPFADQIPLKGVHWVRPELVAEIEFAEWTPDGKLRHPRYVGLRPDIRPSDVRRE
jgi:bifunctional non-homologous end joining protein LigD